MESCATVGCIPGELDRHRGRRIVGRRLDGCAVLRGEAFAFIDFDNHLRTEHVRCRLGDSAGHRIARFSTGHEDEYQNGGRHEVFRQDIALRSATPPGFAPKAVQVRSGSKWRGQAPAAVSAPSGIIQRRSGDSSCEKSLQHDVDFSKCVGRQRPRERSA